MNQVIAAINDRRSVRSYEPKPIPTDVINMIIKAGNQALSRERKETESQSNQLTKLTLILNCFLLRQRMTILVRKRLEVERLRLLFYFVA
jgi:hypothetical protein